MIRLILLGLRFGVLAAVVLLFGQIQVGAKRVSDHVRDITQSQLVQKPIRWITGKFDFKGGEIRAELAEDGKGPDRAKGKTSRTAGESDVAGSDRDLLSGLLKRR
jgi:hypothetical protein